MDPELGTLLVEMVKPPSGPYGFYLARRKESGDRGSKYPLCFSWSSLVCRFRMVLIAFNVLFLHPLPVEKLKSAQTYSN